MVLRAGTQYCGVDYQPNEDVVLEEGGLDDTRQEGGLERTRSAVAEEPRCLSQLLGREVAALFGRFGLMRSLKRGEVQKLKAGVRTALAILEVCNDDGKRVLLEIFAGEGQINRACPWTSSLATPGAH